jgi:ribosomal protein S18 acetylase RimI-like enzyme
MTPYDAISTHRLSPTELLRIRPSLPRDQAELDRMCEQGIREGAFPETRCEPPKPEMGDGLEVDERSEGFWVAELESSDKENAAIVGMISLRPLDDHVVEARQLYVEPTLRGRGIGVQLLEQLVEMCKELGYLKVVLDVGSGSQRAVSLFSRLGFQLARERDISGRRLLDFYLDIYRDSPQ